MTNEQEIMNLHAEALQEITELKRRLRETEAQRDELLEALDKDVARFDGILANMPSLASMTPTQRMSYDAQIAAYRNEARTAIANATKQ